MTSTLDLAVIGNGSVAALVERTGRVVWYCLPRFDGDPVFCALLGNGLDRGYFEIELLDVASCEQRYDENTAILVTTLTDRAGGRVRITDLIPRFKRFERIFRPRMLVRRIEPLAGTPLVRIKLRPAFDYGAVQPTRTAGSNHLRFVGPETTIRLTTDAPLSCVEQESPFALTAPVHLILGPDEPVEDGIQHLWSMLHERTREYWVEWTRYLSIPFEYQEAIIRAAVTLKLCSFEDTGAIVAALTTSIPESPGSGRNWDYRYCWLRDAYFVVQALNRLGATRTMEDHLRWITTVVVMEGQNNLKPVYGILPETSLVESQVTSLPGYRGDGPVRRGNEAYVQHQHDTYGSVILAAAQMFYDQRLPQRGDVRLFGLLETIGEKAARYALEPDAGIWEFRGFARVHTHSAVMCWAGCHRLAKIAGVLGLTARAQHWRAEAERIRKAILERGWNAEMNSFTASFGGNDLDASLLLLHEVGFLAASDPRFQGTVAAIERRLLKDGHLIRYDGADDFGHMEVSFIICTFWYIDALAAMGRRDEARALFERLLERRNHAGLLAEDLDLATGELWGNFPQAYSMVGIIISGMRLSKDWEEAFWRDAS
jgi:GH15 family glucan-1,4-alpha-glucosidase